MGLITTMTTPLDGTLAPERGHALRLLARHGLPVREVVRVDVDSVLYVNRSGQPRTAWLRVNDAALVIHDEPGFSVDQPLAVV